MFYKIQNKINRIKFSHTHYNTHYVYILTYYSLAWHSCVSVHWLVHQFKRKICDKKCFPSQGSIITTMDTKFSSAPPSEQIARVLTDAAGTITAFDIETNSITVNGIGKICKHIC